MNKNNKAFSLIELSIVILVISLLVVGVTKGSRLMSEAKLKSAQALTSSSPVNAMTGVVLWLDATDASTIATGTTYGNPDDGSLVAKWKDHNPQLVRSSQNELAAVADVNRPKYIKNGINGLPTLSFDGSDYLTSSNSAIASAKTGYTMVAVWQSNIITNGMIFAQGGCTTGVNDGNSAGMYIKSNANIASWGCGASGDFAGTTSVYSAKTPYIAVAQVNKNLASNRMSLYLNGTAQSGIQPSAFLPLISAPIFVGAESVSNNFFNGYISELIVFDRSLTSAEIVDVQGYLSRKYSIKIK